MAWIAAAGIVGSSLIGSRSSRRAADASAAGSEAAIAEQRRQFDAIQKMNAPVVSARDDAISALRDLVGLPASKPQQAQQSPAMIDDLPAEIPDYKRDQIKELQGLPRARRSAYGPGVEVGRGREIYRMMARGGTFRRGENIIAGEAGPEIIRSGGNATVVNRPTAFTAAKGGSVIPIPPGKDGRVPYRDVLYASRGDTVTQANGQVTGGNPATYEADPETGEYRVVENDGGREGGYQFQADPGYNFRLDEGRRALDMGAAAEGNLLSGGAIREAIRYNQGFASNEFGNVYNRIANIAQFGQVAANNVNEAGYATGQGVANSIQAGANARASGYLGEGNAIQQAINQGLYAYGNRPVTNVRYAGP